MEKASGARILLRQWRGSGCSGTVLPTARPSFNGIFRYKARALSNSPSGFPPPPGIGANAIAGFRRSTPMMEHPSRADLKLPREELAAFADLHLGKSYRAACEGHGLLPPFNDEETLARMNRDIESTDAGTAVCVGDSFDDMHTAVDIPPFVFRHDAEPSETGEISEHCHPKASIGSTDRRIRLPCFLLAGRKPILPAFGTNTGEVSSSSKPIRKPISLDAIAILTGRSACAIPMPGQDRPAAEINRLLHNSTLAGRDRAALPR